MFDVIVIGAGPAGISAGIYAKRAGANVLILYHGTSNLQRASKIDNYYGFVNGIDGETLYKSGIEQASNIGIELSEEEVLNISKDEDLFNVETSSKQYSSKAVIIATGNKKLRPNIEGVLEFEGKGISYCAICDGFFYRNKEVAIIGNGKYAISEAEALCNMVKKVTILTNGEDIGDTNSFEIITKKIKAIRGDNSVNSVEFADGTLLPVNGVFIAIGEAGSSDFAKKMGIMLKGDDIIINENMETNIDGLYACGNSTGGLLQVSKAVYEGAVAGLSAAKYIKKN